MKKLFLVILLVNFSARAQNTIKVSPEDNLNEVVLSLNPGDTLLFEPGIYFGPIKLTNVHGDFDKPIIFIGPAEIANSAVIDGRRPSPNVAISYNWLEINGSSWLEFVNLHFQNAWIDPLPVNNSSYISFKNCYFQGGRRLINVSGPASHHILVENCFWDQGATYAWNVSSWTDGAAWQSMHHGALDFLNGSLITMQGTSGSHVIRGNTIQNAFNAFRWRGDEGFDANIEIYQNTIKRIRDNDFEPEDYTKNLFIHHNWTHNIHKTLSVDHVKGGNIYYFGNIITNDPDSWSEDICTGYYKVYGTGNDNLSEPLYIFNNSYYGSGRLHGSIGDREMKHVKHYNNAFSLTKRAWELDRWNGTLNYDYDCSNKAFSTILLNNGQEENGVVSDPRFANPNTFDLRLQGDSPCIDAGGFLSIPELNWTSIYEGTAPDIGAFDENEPIQGPFFRTDTLALAIPVLEHPRITQHRSTNDSNYLSFSYPIDETTISGNITVFGENHESMLITDFVSMDNGYSIGFQSRFPVLRATITGPLQGINGLRATNWANAADFTKGDHNDVVVYMLHPQLEPRVPPPPNSNVYLESSLNRSIVPVGTQITVTASADPGYAFERWEGDISGEGLIVTKTLNESAWIIAHFVKEEDQPDEVVLGIESNSILAYPNPNTGILYLKDNHQYENVKVVDMAGKITILKIIDDKLQLSGFKDGIYVLEFENGNKAESVKISINRMTR